jgi:2-haloacid dehalogenase
VTSRAADAVLFDLGGVVLTWEPARAYEQVLAPELVPGFMAEIGFAEWNRSHDAGRAFAVGERELIQRHPEHEQAVLAYRRHFGTTLTGMVPGTGAVLAELAAAGVGLAALTNWSAETFPVARRRFGLLGRFAGVLVSGEEQLAKPDPRIFALALARFGLVAERTVFVDDSPVNVEAARAAGLQARLFVGAEALRADLVDLGLLVHRRPLGRPVHHLTEAQVWRQAQAEGHYPWSSRGLGYEAAGFVHASFAEQLPATRRTVYGDLADDDLVVVELDPDRSGLPVVVEEGADGAYPHLFAPLPVAGVDAAPFTDRWASVHPSDT